MLVILNDGMIFFFNTWLNSNNFFLGQIQTTLNNNQALHENYCYTFG